MHECSRCCEIIMSGFKNGDVYVVEEESDSQTETDETDDEIGAQPRDPTVNEQVMLFAPFGMK